MKDLGFVHRYIPASHKRVPPTLLLLHGTGGDEQDLIPLGSSLLPGAAMLSPRGKVLENGMPRFFRRFAEGIFDIKDLRYRTDELARFIESARLEYGFAAKIAAVGYSNGANIAASLMLLRPELLAGGVLFRAMVPFVPNVGINLTGTRVLLAAGKRDPIVAPDSTRKLAEVLQTAGAVVSFHWHEGGHELGPDDVEAARRWLGSWEITAET